MDKNIYTDGTYLANNPDWDVTESPWKAEIIRRLLEKNNILPADIIEAGCGAGGILKYLAANIGKNANLTGYDISPQAISLAKKYETDRMRFYNEDLLQLPGVSADLVLIIDVLEHVDNFYDFLEKIKPKGKYFVFHIPLDLSCRTILKPHVLLQQRMAVGHIHYFSKEMVLWALQDKGYKVVDWVYTKPIVDTQPAVGFKRRLKKMLRNLSFSVHKDMSAKLWGGYSMMILAE